MTYHETIIVGAGPAGLQMGYYMDKAGRDYLILEANDSAGSFYATQPRHRKLISLNKRHNWYPEAEFNMRHDWNSLLTDDFSHLFGDYSKELFPNADDIKRYLEDFAEKFSLAIQYNTRVNAIKRETDGDKHFVFTDEQGREYRCSRLVMATGVVAPLIPEEIEGIELTEGYEEHDIDTARFENKRVAIIGRGNSAFEVADHLAGHAAIIQILIGNKLIKHAWQTHFVGDLRAVNNTILDMYQLKSLHATIACSATKIEAQPDGTLAVHWESDVPHWDPPGTVNGMYIYDHVIRCTGWTYMNPDLFAPEIAPKMDEKGKYPFLDTSWESSTPDLFFIGTAMAGQDRKAASGFIHGFRYNTRTLFHLLEERYHGVRLPSSTFTTDNTEMLSELVEHMLERVSQSSGLYQLFSVLGDVIVLKPGEAEIFYELPVKHVLNDEAFMQENEVVTVTLEYGFDRYPTEANALDFVHPSPGIECAAFIHPVFRHYVNGELVNKANLDESLSVRYDPNGFDPAEKSRRPQINQNIVMQFMNEATGSTEEKFVQEELYITQTNRFKSWPLDDPRLKNHGIPPCAINGQMPDGNSVRVLETAA